MTQVLLRTVGECTAAATARLPDIERFHDLFVPNDTTSGFGDDGAGTV
jgi:hypothetical protein